MSARIPAVSVVMPVYNTAAFLEQAVNSVRAQTCPDWELILIDDGSTDESAAIAAEFSRVDPRIRLIRNEKNIGVAETRNRGIREARGDWIALLDSDDCWAPEKLEKQLALTEETGADILYCSYAMIRDDGEIFGRPFLVPDSTSLEEMLVSSVISCSTAVIRRERLLEHPFGSSFRHEDLVLWLELLDSGCRACGCREVLAYYRVMERSRSGNKARSALGRWRVFRDYLHLPFLASFRYFIRYALTALKKYKPA